MNLDILSTMTEDQKIQVREWLGTTYDEMVQEGNTKEDLLIGMDILLECLGREGHFAT